jgi:hypothetical protein
MFRNHSLPDLISIESINEVRVIFKANKAGDQWPEIFQFYEH